MLEGTLPTFGHLPKHHFLNTGPAPAKCDSKPTRFSSDDSVRLGGRREANTFEPTPVLQVTPSVKVQFLESLDFLFGGSELMRDLLRTYIGDHHRLDCAGGVRFTVALAVGRVR